MDFEGLDKALRSIYGPHGWVVVADVAAAATKVVAQLRDWGVEDVLVISATEGVGDLPDDVEFHFTRSSGSTIMEGVRAFAHSLGSPGVADAVEAFDPRHDARVLAPAFGLDQGLAGRNLYGGRRPAWRALEDKTIVDELWDRAGVTRAQALVVPVSEAPSAHAAVATDRGAVWVADNTTGWHGGGEYSRWVVDGQDAAEMVEWFRPRAERVRITPFLEGIPTSIHGYVTPRAVGAFRPVEMLIARVVDPPGFSYLGFATTWDPPDWIRGEMREAARRVGRMLSDELGYLGPFSIDGVATSDGFRPTELNPRLSAGLAIQASTVPNLPLGFVTRALYERDLEVDASSLELVIVEAADANRIATASVSAPEKMEPAELPVQVKGESLVPVPDEEADGKLEGGPGPGGSYVRLSLERGVPEGASMAPYAVSAARLVRDRWTLTVPALEPAPDVHR